MRILFDHGVPEPLIPFLERHSVRTAKRAGWDQFVNGKLLAAAEGAGFEILLTTDKRMRYQQNMNGRLIAVVILGNSNWAVARRYVAEIVAALDACTPGGFTEVEIPFK